MKRETNLVEKIANIDNLRLAFWKAKKGKSSNTQVLVFQKKLDRNLLQIRTQILETKISNGNYIYFKIFDPKERLICAAPFDQRVLQHALMNICHLSFEKYQIHDSYASRLGKGTYAALDRAITFQKKYNWYLKLDIRKYFDSIDHNILKTALHKRFKEEKLNNLFGLIIDGYSTEPYKGLPIGNLTSQYFANHYLAISDHFIKEHLKIEAYVRYMDDMVLWSNNKNELLEKGKQFEEFIAAKLKLTLKYFCLNKTIIGLPFLGYVVYKNRLHLNQNSRNRFRAKLKEYEKQLKNSNWSQNQYQAHLLPLLAFAKKAKSSTFRSQCIAQTRLE
jgi:retron-type reverse transcriptase